MNDNSINRRGIMLVVSSPSGAGKTTITRGLLERDDNLELSISMTTRPPRPGETDGKDYFFVGEAEFQRAVKEDRLLEHAQVFGNHYGTPRAAVDTALAEGRDVLFDIDWQGGQQLRDRAGDDVVSIFILPPSLEELERRLIERKQDDPDVVKRRLAGDREMSHWDAYDYIIINRELENSIAQAHSILIAERSRRTRLKNLNDFVASLRRDD